MNEIRCIHCRKLLGKKTTESKGHIEIKCPKCKTIQLYILEVHKEAQVSKVS